MRFLLLVSLLLGTPPGAVGGQRPRQTARPSIVGTWELLTFESRDSAGVTTHPLGKRPKGILVYDQEQRVSAQLFDPDRPRFASGDRATGTDAEVRAAFNGAFAYYGRYLLDTARSLVTHHVEGASFPNWIGTDLVREYRIDHDSARRDRLTITTRPQLVGGHRIVTVLVWRRAP
ncbi:MAG TPA: lipocalin-like domain-containing protein [Gemmatimonadaceae bacterium]|nr:lipocalin-like domain-containing protein [Gemmatimonadaceae bacterium]